MRQASIFASVLAAAGSLISIDIGERHPAPHFPRRSRPTYSKGGMAFTRGKRHRSQKIRANRRKAKARQ